MTRRSLTTASLCAALLIPALDPQLAEARRKRKLPPPPEALFDPAPGTAQPPPAPPPSAAGSAAASAPAPAPAVSAGAGAAVAPPIILPTAPAAPPPAQPYVPPSAASGPLPSAPGYGASVGVQGSAPPPPPIPMQQIYGVPGQPGVPPMPGAPGMPDADRSMGMTSTSPGPAQQKRGRTLLIAGLGALGGSYLLGIAFSSFSYAGFYRGQWGFLIPIAGPIVSMSGADGGFNDMSCPGSCFPKNMYAGFTGAINLAAYLGSIGLVIAGAVTLAPSRRSSPMQARLLPYAGGPERGLLVVGRF